MVGENDNSLVVRIPGRIVEMLKKELDIEEKEIHRFVISTLEKVIAERIGQSNAQIFSEAETKEIEENLKGLGYI